MGSGCMGRIRAGAVYCSDGRLGEHMDDFLQRVLELPRYDRLVVPGGPACLAQHFPVYRAEEAVAEHLDFLVRAHGIRRLVLIQHQDCAYYLQRLGCDPDTVEDRQRDDALDAIARLSGTASGLAVEAYFARFAGDRIRFERIT
jgi:hypothetical protein